VASDLRSRGFDRRRFAVAAALLTALFVLHQDVWLWRDARVVLGLPVGLAYHVAFCVAASVVLALAVRWSWPREVPPDNDASGREARQ
jgi:hypothetical protein